MTMIHANMAMKKYTDSGYETIYYTLFSLPCFAGFSKEKYINKYSLIAFLSFSITYLIIYIANVQFPRNMEDGIGSLSSAKLN